MARNRDSIVKQSRREGFALHPKANKTLVKRSVKPGFNASAKFNRLGSGSQYNRQLREKQKVKRLYGLLEKQFSNTMKKATKMSGQAGENLIILLESRLDNAVYRSGLAVSRQAARQLVSHGHFMLNDRRVDIPSIILKIGDKVEIRPKSKTNSYFKQLDDFSPAPGTIPSWLKVDRKKFKFDVSTLPNPTDLEEEIKEKLIVEYYSK